MNIHDTKYNIVPILLDARRFLYELYSNITWYMSPIYYTLCINVIINVNSGFEDGSWEQLCS